MSDWKVSVAEIVGRPGEYRDFSIDRPISGVKTSLARLEETPVQARLRAESVVEGVLVTGRVRGQALLECARCLTELRGPFDLEVCELFVAPGNRTADEEAYVMSGQEVELEPMLRDAITLDLPLNPLCDAACKGICARCGADLNQAGACACSEDDVDPRWAALGALRDKLEG